MHQIALPNVVPFGLQREANRPTAPETAARRYGETMKTPQIEAQSFGREVLETAGGEVAEGVLLELVASETERDLELVFFDGEKVFRASAGNALTNSYRPIAISTSLLQAIYFPANAAESAKDDELVSAMVGTLRPYAEVQESVLHGLAVWCVTTWLADFLAAPIALLVSGDFSHAMSLFAGLRLCSRRALALAEVDRAFLRKLPWQILPTLLINASTCSPKILATLQHTNVPGFVMAGPRSSVLSVAAPRAIYVPDAAEEDEPPVNVVRVHLPPRRTQGPCVRAHELREQTSQLQRAALAYRFHFWRDHRGPAAPPRPVCPSLQDLFFSAIPNQNQHQKDLLSFLEDQRNGARDRALVDPDRALVEVLWGPAHECKELSVGNITDRLNALLRSRGENKVFNSVEVGFRLRNLGIERRRGQNAKLVIVNREMIGHLHDLAVRFGLRLSNHESCTCPHDVAETKTHR